MYRIDTATKAVDLFGPGKPGFKDGDPTSGVLATKLDADYWNMIQETLAHVIESAGIALDASHADYDQLTAAISAMIIARQPVVTQWGQTQTIPNNTLTTIKPSALGSQRNMTSALNVSTGGITIAAADAGLYLIAAELSQISSAAWSFYLAPVLNGTAMAGFSGLNSGSLLEGYGATTSTIRALAAGDVVAFETQHNAGSSQSLPFNVSLVRLGK